MYIPIFARDYNTTHPFLSLGCFKCESSESVTSSQGDTGSSSLVPAPPSVRVERNGLTVAGRNNGKTKMTIIPVAETDDDDEDAVVVCVPVAMKCVCVCADGGSDGRQSVDIQVSNSRSQNHTRKPPSTITLSSGTAAFCACVHGANDNRVKTMNSKSPQRLITKIKPNPHTPPPPPKKK